MKTSAVITLCLAALGPAVALADNYRRTEIHIEEYNVYQVEGYERNAGYHQSRHYRDRYDRRGWRHDHQPPPKVVVKERIRYVEPVSYRERYDDRHSCVRYVDDHDVYYSHTPALLGAIIGSAVGHRLGNHSGNQGVVTVAGALLGGSVGRDIGSHVHDGRRIQVEGPCRP